MKALPMLIDFEGISINAKEVNWHELGTMETIHRISGKPGKYLYLGNRPCALDRRKECALFSDPEGTKYCIRI